MKTLCRKQEDEEEEQRSSDSMTLTTTVADRSLKKNKKRKLVSFPIKKEEKGGLFISAYDYLIKRRYYFSAAKDGGPLTLLMTVDEDTGLDITGPSHLNGFMCFTSRTWTSPSPTRLNAINSHAFVVNPATRKVFQLPDSDITNPPSAKYWLYGYLYGFDESRNEHKILIIKKVDEAETHEFMIFSMSSYSWRKIDADPPVVGFEWRRMSGEVAGGVCVNSIVHVLLQDLSYDILAFDFVTEKFSVFSLPQGVLPPGGVFFSKNSVPVEFDRPYITKIDGCLAVFLHSLKRSQVHIWLLQDYDNGVWVKEIVKLPKSWNMTINDFPLSIDVNMDDEIVFNVSKVTKNRVTVPVYNRKTKHFKTLEFKLDDQFASVIFYHIKCYVETMMPLRDNWSLKSHGKSE